MHHNFIRIYGGCDSSLRKKNWLITFQKKGCRFAFVRRGLTATRSCPRYVRNNIVVENTVFVLCGLTSTRAVPGMLATLSSLETTSFSGCGWKIRRRPPPPAQWPRLLPESRANLHPRHRRQLVQALGSAIDLQAHLQALQSEFTSASGWARCILPSI